VRCPLGVKCDGFRDPDDRSIPEWRGRIRPPSYKSRIRRGRLGPQDLSWCGYTAADMKFPLRLSSNHDSNLADVLDELTRRLDRLLELTEETNRLLSYRKQTNRTEAQQTFGATRTQNRRQPRRGSGQGKTSIRTRRTTMRSSRLPTRQGLHHAIEAVLLEAREPLTAAEITERINDRQLFVPPRSGKPLSSDQVNSRISNTHYRNRFRRENGRVRLAADRTRV
jgi:hypothetical protein